LGANFKHCAATGHYFQALRRHLALISSIAPPLGSIISIAPPSGALFKHCAAIGCFFESSLELSIAPSSGANNHFVPQLGASFKYCTTIGHFFQVLCHCGLRQALLCLCPALPQVSGNQPLLENH
jgi:hypothetical protein